MASDRQGTRGKNAKKLNSDGSSCNSRYRGTVYLELGFIRHNRLSWEAVCAGWKAVQDGSVKDRSVRGGFVRNSSLCKIAVYSQKTVLAGSAVRAKKISGES